MWWCKCKCLQSSYINETIVASSRTGNEAMHANGICKFFTHFTPISPCSLEFVMLWTILHSSHIFSSTEFDSSISASTSKLWDVVSPSHLWSTSAKHIIYILHICIECSISQRSCAHTCLRSKIWEFTSKGWNSVCYLACAVLCCIFLNLDPVLGPRMTWIWPWLFDQNFPPFGQRTDLLVAWCR